MNEQPQMPVDREESGKLVVHSIFPTIQGEGPFAGHAAIFIRLFGCNLQCPMCDTDYTSTMHKATPQEIIEQLSMFERHELVVITGGEPFRQNVIPLTDMLLNHGYKVQFESNGVFYPGDDFPWGDRNLTVVVSPKTPKIHPETAKRASAFKYVLSHDSVAPDGLPKQALAYDFGLETVVARPPAGWVGPVYLNPMDSKHPIENLRNARAVVKSVMEHQCYIMGIQMHKEVGLP